MRNNKLMEGAIALSESLKLEIGDYTKYPSSLSINFYDDDDMSAVKIHIYNDNTIQIETEGYLTAEQLLAIGEFAKKYVEPREAEDND